METKKTIYCPRCNWKVATYDGKSKMNIAVKCKKCHRLVVYNPNTDSVLLKDVPGRNQSSGMRFY